MAIRRQDADVHDEIQAHLALETDRLIADGMPPAEAAAAARKAFGNVLKTEEYLHEQSRWVWIEQFLQDVRYGVRGLKRSPAFVATTVLSLSLGISLVIIVFAIFNAYVLRPFAVRDPSSLYSVAWSAPNESGNRFSQQDFQELRDRRDLFDEVMAESTALGNLGSRTLVSAFVSDNYFRTLRPGLEVGHIPLANEDALVLSYDAWKGVFNQDPAVIGQTREFGRHKLTIAGVMGPAFTGLDDSPRDIWLPLRLYPSMAQVDLSGPNGPRILHIIARLRPGVTAAQTQTALTPFMAHMTASPATAVKAVVTSRATPIRLTPEVLGSLSVPFVAFLLVLITACANVSNIMLARANARFREISVRLSIGASRNRLIRQLLTEGLLISLLAAALGLLFAVAGLRAGVGFFLGALPPSAAASIRVLPLEFDHRVLLFTLAAAAATTFLFALAPALQTARLSLTDVLRGHSSETRTGSRLRSGLVVMQVMVSLILLVVTITVARGAAQLGAADPGIDRTGVVTVRPRVNQDQLLPGAWSAMSQDSHVESVAAASVPPLSETSRQMRVSPASGAQTVNAVYTFVTDRYFETLRIPILRGRNFTAQEGRSEAKLAIVSAHAAQTLWPNADPVGQLLRIRKPETAADENFPGYDTAVVIGVVRDVMSSLIFGGFDAAHVYLPTNASSPHASVLLVRGHSQQDVRPEITQKILRNLHPEATAFEVMPLDEAMALQMFPIRITSWIGSLLGGIALALSLSGLYAVLTYTLTQRMREIGIRIALGASRSSVARLVLMQSMRMAGLGALIGMVIAAGVMKALGSTVELRNISIIDLPSFGLSLAFVLLAASLASLFPARRASAVDPGATLRVDN
jgi:predicted permease